MHPDHAALAARLQRDNPHLAVATLEDCGRNLNHDRPERLAGIVAAFLLSD